MNLKHNTDDGHISISGQRQFIAFIDILGFRTLLLRSPNLEEFVEKYSSVFKPLRNEIQTLGIKHTLFSDSLFLAVENRPLDEQLKSLLIFSKKLLTRSISSKLPIRGAISYGTVIWKGDIVVGMPIIEAVEQESLQDWLGIILAPSCISYCFNHEKMIDHLVEEKLIIKYDEIPVRDSSEKITGYAINFLNDDDKADEICLSLETMRILACSVKAEKKYRETEKYLNLLERQKQSQQIRRTRD